MALFSRRPKKSDEPAAPAEDPAIADESTVNSTEAEQQAPEEVVPQVNISMSTYGKSSAPTPPALPDNVAKTPLSRPDAEAPAPTESVPGLRDNVLVRQALSGVSKPPEPTELLNVARQLLQGHVFLRIQGDAKELLAAGKDLPLSVAKLNGKPYVLAFSGGAAIQDAVRADGNSSTSAVGQPVLNVLKHAISGDFAGLIVDHASSPASAVLPRALLERTLEQADDDITIKELLAAVRTPDTGREVARAMSTAPLWLAGKRTDGGKFGIAEYRAADGTRALEVFTHPLELLALGRGDQPLPITAAQLATALRGNDQLTGVFVNPAGPWIRLTRDELAPMFEITAPDEPTSSE
ncbi:hypothetical protein FHX49_001202 [Microbacterium endophyticum]|uniref:SseB protein N-terminal domain-containing protein n=1 Tax=Microbacterium endophyticum TaxID=1526412 RepID=A0A7W4V2K4_9MICO|nr:SseB family protein [Microbacterium endophyticum]MBB2975636.1 hypothetical protein [Microbacterium endophyticum]NIK35345.1 hypothetical protein [Microbacterium endophyticum]